MLAAADVAVTVAVAVASDVASVVAGLLDVACVVAAPAPVTNTTTAIT